MSSDDLKDHQNQDVVIVLVAPSLLSWTHFLRNVLVELWAVNLEMDCSDQVSLLLSLRHAHKNTVMEVKWNLNGNWLLTASRDHLCKLFDIRNLKEELQVFRGHKKEATGEME